MACRYSILASLVAAAASLRQRTGANSTGEETGNQGIVSNLFTYGCPKVSAPAMTNEARSDGCFPGYRVVNIKDDWAIDNVDIVPSLLVSTKYKHTKMRTMMVDQKKKVKFDNCGTSKFRVMQPSASLHMKDVYIDRTVLYSDASLRVASSLGLKISYESDLATVRSTARGVNWRLIGSASVGEDVSHLVQSQASKACMVTFEGSDSFDDWMTDAAVIRKEFCGLSQGVHQGFRGELRKIAKSAGWQSSVRSKFAGCNGVWAVGHSLGGAVATLFSACANSHNSGNIDYEDMGWIAGQPQLHSEI